MQTETNANTSFKRSAPLKIGLITNPHSQRNRRTLDGLRHSLHRLPTLRHFITESASAVSDSLFELAREEIDVLAINGGDGTVQTVLSELFNLLPFRSLPLLALIGGGTTNMNAGDVGLKGNPRSAVRRLAAWAENPHNQAEIRHRSILRIEAPCLSAPRFGMFFGTGAIINGIEHFHAKVRSKGLRDGLGPAISAVRILIGLYRADPRYAAPAHVHVETQPDPGPGDREYFLVSATTLERLILGIYPYWGAGSGAFHYTALRFDPAHLLRSLPALLRGNANRFATPENGYHSGRVDSLHLTLEGKFTLDGELYDTAGETETIRVTSTEPVGFVRL